MSSPMAAKAAQPSVARSQARRRAAGRSAATRKSPALMIISSPLPLLAAAFSCASSHLTSRLMCQQPAHMSTCLPTAAESWPRCMMPLFWWTAAANSSGSASCNRQQHLDHSAGASCIHSCFLAMHVHSKELSKAAPVPYLVGCTAILCSPLTTNGAQHRAVGLNLVVRQDIFQDG